MSPTYKMPTELPQSANGLRKVAFLAGPKFPEFDVVEFPAMVDTMPKEITDFTQN